MRKTMKTILRAALPALAGTLVLVSAGAAQQLAVELRGGAAVGNHIPASAGLETLPGPSFSGAVEFTAVPMLSVYVGYVRSAFGCEEGFCRGQDVTFTASGFSGGARIHLPGLPWARVGLVQQSVAAKTESASTDEGSSIGAELGLGGTVPISRQFSLLPGLTYRKAGGAEGTAVLAAEVGVRFSF